MRSRPPGSRPALDARRPRRARTTAKSPAASSRSAWASVGRPRICRAGITISSGANASRNIQCPAAGFVQGHQARHADQEREPPVGSTRARETDEARLERLDEPTTSSTSASSSAGPPPAAPATPSIRRGRASRSVSSASSETKSVIAIAAGEAIGRGGQPDQLTENRLHRLGYESRAVGCHHASAQDHRAGGVCVASVSRGAASAGRRERRSLYPP